MQENHYQANYTQFAQQINAITREINLKDNYRLVQILTSYRVLKMQRVKNGCFGEKGRSYREGVRNYMHERIAYRWKIVYQTADFVFVIWTLKIGEQFFKDEIYYSIPYYALRSEAIWKQFRNSFHPSSIKEELESIYTIKDFLPLIKFNELEFRFGNYSTLVAYLNRLHAPSDRIENLCHILNESQNREQYRNMAFVYDRSATPLYQNRIATVGECEHWNYNSPIEMHEVHYFRIDTFDDAQSEWTIELIPINYPSKVLYNQLIDAQRIRPFRRNYY